MRTSKSSNAKTNVVDLEWRPDGKVLAAAYRFNVFDPAKEASSSQPSDCMRSEGEKSPDGSGIRFKSSIGLIETEQATVVHVIELESIVTCLNWRPRIGRSCESNGWQAEDYFMMDPLDFLETLKVSSKQGNIKAYGNVPMRKLTDETIADLMKESFIKMISFIS